MKRLVLAFLVALVTGSGAGYGAAVAGEVDTLVPTYLRVEYLDEDLQVLWDSEEEDTVVEILPGLNEQQSLLLSPFVMGLEPGETVLTPPLEDSLGSITTVSVPRVLFNGSRVHVLNRSHLPPADVGDTLNIQPFGINATVVGIDGGTMTVRHDVESGRFTLPSNLTVAIEGGRERLGLTLPYEPGDTFELVEPCSSGVAFSLDPGWYRVERANETNLTLTAVSFQDARSFEDARHLASGTVRLRLTVMDIDWVEGVKDRWGAGRAGVLEAWDQRAHGFLPESAGEEDVLH